jgi:hypothetical protein
VAFSKIERIVFYFLLALAVAIIAVPKVYLTCDGPSHTYNSKILFDYILNHNREFLKEFFTVNKSPDPNWMSQLLIGTLMQAVPALLAEKIFQIGLLLIFAFGLRYLIKAIQVHNTFLSCLFYPFFFTLPFQTGFYNYCLSIAFMLWSIAYYLRNRENFTSAHSFVMSILLLLATLSHAMPVLNGLFCMGLIVLSQINFQTLKKDLPKWLNYIGAIGLAALPSLMLIVFFTLKRGFANTPHTLSLGEKLKNFFQMYCCQSTVKAEQYPAIASGLLIIVFLIIALIKLKNTWVKIGTAFLGMAIFTFIAYLRSPNDIGGAGSIDIRLAFLPPFYLLITLAAFEWKPAFKNIFISVSGIITLSFFVLRLPSVFNASVKVNTILKAASLIKDKSIIGTLHYDDYDRDFEIDNSYAHVSDYLGLAKNKSLIILQNYEADLSWFSLQWHPQLNPRNTINNLYQGTYPPSGNFENYEQATGKLVDYVFVMNDQNKADSSLLVNYNKIWSANPPLTKRVYKKYSLWERK